MLAVVMLLLSAEPYVILIYLVKNRWNPKAQSKDIPLIITKAL